MDKLTETKLGNRIINILLERKGFDWWWNRFPSNTKSAMRREIGKEVLGILKELRGELSDGQD